jgi:hypothetical protein
MTIFVCSQLQLQQVAGMDSCNTGAIATPVRAMHGSGPSSQEPFQTLNNLINDAFGNESVITPVMEAALYPLMHKSLHTPPLTITPTMVDTPPSESHTHVNNTLRT